MIIKDKPFRVLSSSCVQCAWYFPAAVVGYAARPRGYSVFGYAALLRWVRRGPGFVKLEAYQVRLSGYLVRNWSDLGFYRMLDACVDDFSEDLAFMYDRRVFLARRDFMDVFELLSDRTSRCFPMRLVEARAALHRLGGLGGVW